MGEQDAETQDEPRGLVEDLFAMLENEESVQWHREHDRQHGLYLRAKRFLETQAEKRPE